ncbi:hypothetical protein E2C01_047606 [Portunus trituberculatus]|uniref:Uncharacterized protein n=1 Tax=Portunus trituberculatus TaxID=210409 RepID=A0A5B7G9C6_PORTR|nr:hypothetical protein [Portunus trituberculatus]
MENDKSNSPLTLLHCPLLSCGSADQQYTFRQTVGHGSAMYSWLHAQVKESFTFILLFAKKVIIRTTDQQTHLTLFLGVSLSITRAGVAARHTCIGKS